MHAVRALKINMSTRIMAIMVGVVDITKIRHQSPRSGKEIQKADIQSGIPGMNTQSGTPRVIIKGEIHQMNTGKGIRGIMTEVEKTEKNIGKESQEGSSEMIIISQPSAIHLEPAP